MFWKNTVKLVGRFTREWNEAFKNSPMEDSQKIGYSIQVRLPQRFRAVEGQALVQQPILNQTTTITVNHQQHVGMGWSSADASLLVEEVQERYTMPTGEALATQCDIIAGLETYQSISNFIGTPGVPLSVNQTWLDGMAKLRNLGVPGPYTAIIDPKTESKLLGAQLIQFNPQARISEYFTEGRFAEGALGIDTWETDTVGIPTHTTGTFTTSTPLVDGALQTGSTIVLKGLGTYSFNAGDNFTLLGVNAANPIGFTDTGDPLGFVITAPASGVGAATLSIYPPIITSGPLQTVVQSPANNAQVFFQGATAAVNGTMSAQASKQCYVMNAGAMAFVVVDLKENLAGARTAMERSKTAKISMRWVEQFNIQTDQNPSRCDIMFGVAPVLPYFAMRGWS